MSTAGKVIVGYLILIAVGFAVVYGVLGVREFGLYIALGVLNVPASLVVMPLLERVALSFGLPLGGAVHVGCVQVISMVANGAVIAGAVAMVRHLRRGARKVDDEV